MCGTCYADPNREREQRSVGMARGEPVPYDIQRRELIRRYHWAGGWPRA